MVVFDGHINKINYIFKFLDSKLEDKRFCIE